MKRRIHILGASGAGTTTLGQALSKRFTIPYFDTDDYFWVKTDIPFTEKRDSIQRAKLLERDLLRFPEWVLSGSLCGWGDFVISLFTLVVFLWIPHDLRMERLEAREIERYGSEAISSGGWFHQHHEDFMVWASKYDSTEADMRSKELHEQWMDKLPCRLLRIEAPLSIQELTDMIEQELDVLKKGV